MFNKAGCGGFPVSRLRYFKAFGAVEIGSTGYHLPQLSTVRHWKEESPEGFEFSLRAFQVITHPATSFSYEKILPKISERRKSFCGHFKATPEVGLAWEGTRSVAEAMGARFVVFETPETFYPDANHLRDMYRFFKSLRRGDLSLIWQPRANWTLKMIEKVCGDLGLIHAVNPLAGPCLYKVLNYFRLPRPSAGSYSDFQMKEILNCCRDLPSYVFFVYAKSWQDAQRFEALRCRRENSTMAL